jgi:glutathione S-transferase
LIDAGALSQTLPIFYSFRRCPYAMRARMALLTAAQQVELREVSLKAKPAEMIVASPKATVPVLVLPNGEVINESLDIMRWALARNDPDHWLAPAAAMDPLIATNDGPFKLHLDRAKYPSRYPDEDAQLHWASAAEMIQTLEARLKESTWLMGPRQSLADIALFPFIRQFAAIDPAAFAALPLPHLQKWLAEIASSPRFAAVMIKRPNWEPSQAPFPWP